MVCAVPAGTKIRFSRPQQDVLQAIFGGAILDRAFE